MMMSPIDILVELQRRYSEEPWAITQDDIDRWTAGLEEDEEALYDSIAAALASGYHERRYSFEFCDRVVNDLYGPFITKQQREPPPPWPKLFWSVYEAFDAGEFHRMPDMSANPIAEFTDPAIAEIVRDLQRP